MPKYSIKNIFHLFYYYKQSNSTVNTVWDVYKVINQGRFIISNPNVVLWKVLSYFTVLLLGKEWTLVHKVL